MSKISKLHKLHHIIREDLIQNQEELFYRYNYYTKKYRSKELDFAVNVGLFLDGEESNRLIAQIYLEDRKTKLREQFILNNSFNIVDSNLIIRDVK
jgi:uncharacterized protein YlaN (UPF0358 family)